jgi:hypothetical protein
MLLARSSLRTPTLSQDARSSRAWYVRPSRRAARSVVSGMPVGWEFADSGDPVDPLDTLTRVFLGVSGVTDGS